MTSIDRFHHLGHSPVDPVPGSPAPDRAVRNGQVRRAVARLAATRRVTLRVRSTRRQEGGEPRVEHYLFEHEGRRELRAVLLAPPGPGPWPAVLVCAGRNATLERVTGLLPPDHPGRDVAAHLTRAGFLTLTLDHGLDRWAEPATLGGRDPGDVLDGTLRLRGGSLLGAMAEDAGAALDWLRAHPDVASGRVGLFGHSMGAAVALHAALLREEPLPLCAASHLGTYETMIGRSLAWNQYVALPSILRHADLPDLYAALAPAPLQIQYGTADGRLDPGDAKAAGERIVGAHDTAEILALPMGHGTGLAEAADFFTRSLAEPTTNTPDVSAAGTPGDLPPVRRTCPRPRSLSTSGPAWTSSTWSTTPWPPGR